MGEIRFVGTDKTRGYPYQVCMKEFSSTANIAQTLSHIKNCKIALS